MEPASVDSTTWILSTSLVYYVSVDRYSVVNNFAAVYLKVNVLGLDQILVLDRNHRPVR